MHEVHYPS
jgi:hypothetical protein